jgi:transcriptional regulator with XRE-family HTH domain
MTNLKRIREDKKISQSQLAELSGVNLRTLQYYEQGYKDINKAQGITLYKLAQALDCRVEALLELQ